MLETVWIKHESLLNLKNNKTYHSDMTLVVAEDVISYIAESERRKLVFNQDRKDPRIFTYAIDTALVFIDDMFFCVERKW